MLRSPGRLLRWFRLLAGALWVLACAAQTDPVDLGRPAQRLFTDKDGLPQNSIEGIVVTDCQGTILQVNQAFSVITGYSVEEAIGQNPRILKSNRHSDTFY